MKKEDYAGKAIEVADKVMKRYTELKEKYEIVGDVRGLGAMIGIEFVKDKESKEPYTEFVANLVQTALQKGLLIENAGTASNVVRFLAPLCITDEQLKEGLDIFEESIKETLGYVLA